MIFKLVKIQVRLLHAYQNKHPEGFAATSLDEIKMLNNSQEAGFRCSLYLAWARALKSDGEGDGGIEISCGRTVQAIHPSS